MLTIKECNKHNDSQIEKNKNNNNRKRTVSFPSAYPSCKIFQIREIREVGKPERLWRTQGKGHRGQHRFVTEASCYFPRSLFLLSFVSQYSFFLG